MRVLSISTFSVAFLLATAGLWAGPKQPASPPAGVVVENMPVIAGEPALTRIKSSVNRSVMVNSLIADTDGRAALAQEAARWGVSDSQLSSAATKQVQKPLPPDGSLSAVDMFYNELDWGVGFTFVPSKSPAYAGYHVAATTVSQAQIGSYSDFVVISTPPCPSSSVSGQTTYVVVRLLLELSAQPLSYLVAVRLLDKDGSAPPEWLQHAGGLTPPVSVLFRYCDAKGEWQDSSGRLMAPLSTSNGYVGLFGITPTGYYKPPAGADSILPPKMRRCNAEVQLRIAKDSATPAAVDGLVFAGVTTAML